MPSWRLYTAKNLASRPAVAAVAEVFARKNAPKRRASNKSDRPIFWPAGQLFTGHRRRLTLSLHAALCCVAWASCGGAAPDNASKSSTTARREAVASVRNEPRAFNRFVMRDSATDLVAFVLTQSKLVRINKETQELEPWLAESWTTEEPGRRYLLKLRQGIAFSDGHPFTADDVVFSFQVAYDPRTPNQIGDTLTVGHKQFDVAALDSSTIRITFPSTFMPGLRSLDNLPILPRHKLEAPFKAGTFGQAWSLTTAPSDIVGLGPFVLKEYAAGQRLVFERNPRYWRKDANGVQLPYLDRLVVEIIPDANAELLRLQAGQLDVPAGEVPPDSYASVKRAADAGHVRQFDVGVALDADSLWFNLKPGVFAKDPRGAWLQRDEFRRALSMAVDRRVFADTVFFGAAEPVDGPETPSNKKWYSADIPKVPYDPEAAKKLLASIGASNASFTLITQKGRPRLERGAAVIRDELKKIGVTVDVVLLEANALIQRFAVQHDYEAVYFNPQKSDTDPGANLDFWNSGGSAHLWNMSQSTPATPWERQIDELMARQVASPDENERRRLYTDVLRIFADHQPVLYFAAPRLSVAVSSRVTLTPAVAPLPALWSPDTVSVIR